MDHPGGPRPPPGRDLGPGAELDHIVHPCGSPRQLGHGLGHGQLRVLVLQVWQTVQGTVGYKPRTQGGGKDHL